MLTILGKPESINVRKVLWACDEIGLQYIHDPDWGGRGRSTHEAEFLRLNPHALVPVLRDGDVTLWESNSILRYLAAKHGRHDLLPADPAGRARVEMWMDWQLGDFNNAWRYAFQALVRRNPANSDPAEIERSVQGWTAQVMTLDRHLQQGQAHVAGEDFTAADIVIGLSVHRWFAAPLPHPDVPAVTAYYRRLGARPAFVTYTRNCD